MEVKKTVWQNSGERCTSWNMRLCCLTASVVSVVINPVILHSKCFTEWALSGHKSLMVKVRLWTIRKVRKIRSI